MSKEDREALALISLLVAVGGAWLQNDRAKEHLKVASKQLVEDKLQRQLQTQKDAEDKAARVSPFLAVSFHCNQVPLDPMTRNPAHFDPAYASYQAKDYENFRWGYVVCIQNLGSGSALETKVSWQVLNIEHTFPAVNYPVAVKQLTPAESRDETTVSSPTSPAFILPEAHAKIFRLPAFVYRKSESFKVANGKLVIKCLDISGNSHQFSQEFTIEVCETPHAVPEVRIPIASLHFDALEHTCPSPKRYVKPRIRVAKPPLHTKVTSGR